MNTMLNKKSLFNTQKKVRNYFHFADEDNSAFDRRKCFDYQLTSLQDYNEKMATDIYMKDDNHIDRYNEAYMDFYYTLGSNMDIEEGDFSSARHDIADVTNRPAFERYKFLGMRPFFAHILAGFIFSIPMLMLGLIAMSVHSKGNGFEIFYTIFSIIYMASMLLMGVHKALADYSHPKRSSSIWFWLILFGMLALSAIVGFHL